MVTEIYETETIYLMDDTKIELSPLKIKYLKEFMKLFNNLKNEKEGIDSLDAISKCILIAMKQYCPNIKTKEELEDVIDLQTMYTILNFAAGIKPETEQSSKQSDSENTWDNFDLAKLESEIFLTGIWKNYEELELSISLPELMSTLEIKRELDYSEKKFAAGLKGIDLDEQIGINSKEEDPWERLKARVASGGTVDSANDIVGYQGERANQHGFGIGMGLDYATEL